MAEIIFNLKDQAHLPLTATYTPDVDSEVTLMFCGSAWSKKQSCKIGLILEIDGEDVGTTEIYSNGVNTHRVLMPGMLTYKFKLELSNGSPKPVEIKIKALNDDTIFDQYDAVSLTIL